MQTVKEFFRKKTVGYYISAITFLFALISLITYAARGGNSYSPVSQTAVVVLTIGVITNALVLIKDFKIGAFIPYILYVVTLGILLNTEMLFITNVLESVDGNSFDGAFFVFMIFLALAIICGFAAAVMKKSKAE